MYALMDTYYANVSWSDFLADLREKQWILTLEDSGRLVGFSTQKCFTHVVRGRACRVVFSGDTVIHHDHRGSQALAWAFGRLLRDISRTDPETPLYWLLISKGIRTYRYLPIYFEEFFPRFDRATPEDMRGLMDSLGASLFPDRYDPARGLLAALPGGQHLRAFDTPERVFHRSRGHHHFFEMANPGARRGDELLCLARFNEANVRPAVWDAISRQGPLLSPRQRYFLEPAAR